MTYAFKPFGKDARTVVTAVPLPWRTPTERLVLARQDHAICLRLAASYRVRVARGERGVRELHAWALGHARTLSLRFPGALS